MAAYSSNPGNDSDYSDAAPAPTETEPMEKESDKDQGETALIPESLLAGKKFEVGEEVMFKIVSMHDGQVEIAYATDHDESKEHMDEGGGEGEQPAPQDEMGQMMY
jgi:imidazolonepropionase-like amidohydrolase